MFLAVFLFLFLFVFNQCYVAAIKLLSFLSILQIHILVVKTVHACLLTSKFLVQPSNAECGGLETAYKDSPQMFQHSDRMFEQILQISFKISFGA